MRHIVEALDWALAEVGYLECKSYDDACFTLQEAREILEQQREDAGLVIWRSMKHCEGRPDIALDNYMHLKRIS